ncbi:alpha/beta hydrolase [Roseibium denhamense]|uniref:Esterase/lipase superfamily enzyme n=1 Tax=Roseibium denhamense TaxID=76305 RepID=A0ABY1NS52_9HYPH|nr:alpha/beta hydrolase [Roseibium denhamense]MTI08156.1 alpha/beta hydrolase [Roseibium denhamense]SMP16820.1 Esterase/lipase superfamily enzyme [Roseibium denhamense]
MFYWHAQIAEANLFPHLGRTAAIILMCMLVAACASRPVSGALEINSTPAEGAKVHDILVVTTRQRDAEPDTYFNGERSETVNFADVSISVPPAHKPGMIEWPRSLPGDPSKDFVARSAAYIDTRQDFRAQLNKRLSERPASDREAVLFIHGYNTLFAEGLYRFTQFVHDRDGQAVPVLFTWASRGQVQDYLYDLNSAAIARDALEETLLLLADSNARRISILAHSMGNWLLMETIRQMSESNRQKIGRKLEIAVLAAPDIDIDLFKSSLRKFGNPDKPFVIVISKDDRALRLSRALAGGVERVGAYSNDQELAALGAVVIDVTDLESNDAANHSKFAELAEFGPEIQQAVVSGGLSNTSSVTGPTNLGDDLSTFVGATAQTAVSLPIRIITAPITAVTGGY